MSRFTILHTIETAGPGGAETVLLHLAARLDCDRFRSIVLLPGKGWLSERLEEAGVPVHFVDSNRWYDFRVPRAMRDLIRREKIDLIHSHLPTQNFYSCLAGSLAGRKTVVTYHGAIELDRSDGWKETIRLAGVRHMADAVVVVCNYVGRLLLKARFSPEKIVRIYNGINVDRFRAPAPGRLRKELNLPDGAKLVGCVANLRESKGHTFLIQAARMVIARVPDAHFVAVGDIDPEIGRPLFALVDELHLQDRFHFLGFRRDVPEVLGELDVFVLPSVSEGFPLVALEAMAASRPVVATQCGGPEEVVEDGVTGMMIPPGDAGAIAAAVMELLANRELAAGLAARGLAKVEAGFTLEKMVGEYEALYQRLLEAV
jgi:glycosyltransferase involved in cell wall biosynthesis